MARSAKQRAARNLKRRPRPVFEFTKLPPDVQFLVLCNCDFISITRLINGSSSIRNLYLRYPETTIQSALEKIPPPVANLLHVASTLESVTDDGFDADEMLEFLKQANLVQWSNRYPQLLTERVDALQKMQSLVDIYTEVKVAANTVAQAMNAAAGASLDRLVVVAPISLSVTEQMRMMCALLVVRTYYQLRFKFQYEHSRRGRQLIAAFVRTLAPWQLAQCSSIEEVVDSCVNSRRIPLDKVIDKRYTCGESLSQKSVYLRDYIQASVSDMETGNYSGQLWSDIPRYSGAVRAEEMRRRQRSWAGPVSELEYPGWHSADQLCGYGWTMCNPISPGNKLLQRVILRCGILFWDQSRLEDWDVADCRAVVELGRWTCKLYGCYPNSPRKDCEEEVRSQQIVEWTRSHVQISFDEFVAGQEEGQ